MRFVETPLRGAFVVEWSPSLDERGFFARVFSAKAFRTQGLEADLSEISISRNTISGTLRGMHYQREPHGEVKFVRVVRGKAFDVILDIRSNSPTRGAWFGVELSAANGTGLYVPQGFAHGFLTLENETDILYQITDTFHPKAAAGFHWNDSRVDIRWPCPPTVISAMDSKLPRFADSIGA